MQVFLAANPVYGWLKYCESFWRYFEPFFSLIFIDRTTSIFSGVGGWLWSIAIRKNVSSGAMTILPLHPYVKSTSQSLIFLTKVSVMNNLAASPCSLDKLHYKRLIRVGTPINQITRI